MKIKPVAFDSFSTRSMATIIETDLKIFIDPSIAIAPRRYGLEPSKIELNELNKKKKEIIEEAKSTDLFIITHYHWDHCPNPNEEHFEIFKSNAKFLIKDFNKTNKSQLKRGNNVISEARKLNNEFIFEFADNKNFEMNNTFIEFSKPLNHGVNDLLGKIIMIKISYKNNNVVFASDIQGINNKETLNELIKFNPYFLILSGPATYHYKWKNKWTKRDNHYLKELIEKTDIKTIIIDHHLLRDLNYKEKIKEVIEFSKQFNVKIITAAEFLGIENKQLEAKRKELINKNPKNIEK
ncbi:MAG: hypothetical protein ABGW69_03805 [Nanoarchaeota archaeon]